MELLLAEQEHIAGLPAPPQPLPLPGLLPPPAGFTLRRVECTCQSHQATRQHLQRQLELLESSPDAWAGAEAAAGAGAAGGEDEAGQEEQREQQPGSREEAIAQLRWQLQQLGLAPARLALPVAQELRLRQEAEERVARGDCGVQVGCLGAVQELPEPLGCRCGARDGMDGLRSPQRPQRPPQPC